MYYGALLEMMIKKVGSVKISRWAMVKCGLTETSSELRVAWNSYVATHPRFVLHWSIGDPTVKRLTGQKFIWFRKGETRCVYRFQVIALHFQITIFRSFKYKVGDVVCDISTNKYAPPAVEIIKRWKVDGYNMYTVRRVLTKGHGWPASEESLV